MSIKYLIMSFLNLVWVISAVIVYLDLLGDNTNNIAYSIYLLTSILILLFFSIFHF